MKLLYKFLPFIILKQPLGLPLYFNVFAPMFGLIYILRYKKIYTCYIPIFIIIVINAIVCIFFAQVSSIFRLVQFALILFFSMYLTEILKKYDLFLVLKIILAFIIFTFLLEVLVDNNAGYRNFFGLRLLRHRGVLGEYNFTALLLVGIGLLFAVKKMYCYSALSFLSIVFTANRSFLVSLSLFVFLFIISKINKRIGVYFGYLCIFLMFFYPFIILEIDKVLNIDNKILIDKFSSTIFQHERYIYIYNNFVQSIHK